MPADLFGPVHMGRSTRKVAKDTVLLLARPLAGWASPTECLLDPKASKLWHRGNLWQRLNDRLVNGTRPRPLLAPAQHWDLPSTKLTLRSFGPRSGLFPALESLSEGKNCQLQLLKDAVAASQMHLSDHVQSQVVTIEELDDQQELGLQIDGRWLPALLCAGRPRRCIYASGVARC